MVGSGDFGLMPGQRVRLPAAPDWGPGQVQSVAGQRVTVNFEDGGKKVVRIDVSPLELLQSPEETP